MVLLSFARNCFLYITKDILLFFFSLAFVFSVEGSFTVCVCVCVRGPAGFKTRRETALDVVGRQSNRLPELFTVSCFFLFFSSFVKSQWKKKKNE